MVFYTLAISVFNLALGYFLAQCLQSCGISPAWPQLIIAKLFHSGDTVDEPRDSEPVAVVSPLAPTPIEPSALGAVEFNAPLIDYPLADLREAELRKITISMSGQPVGSSGEQDQPRN